MRKVGIFITSLAASSALVTIRPAVAATFNFSFSNKPFGPGVLSFDGTVPTGTVTLSQLNNARLEYSFLGIPSPPTVPPGGLPILFSPDSADNTTLTFADGTLTGITTKSTLNNYNVAFYLGGSSGGEIKGNYALFLQGNTYAQYFTGETIYSIYDFSTNQSNVTTTAYNNSEQASGNLIFQNPQRVPEPSTMLGTIVALGIATRFNRRHNSCL